MQPAFNGKRAQQALIAFYALAIVTPISIWSSYRTYQAFKNDNLSIEEMDSYVFMGQSLFIGLAYTLIVVWVVITFIRWIRRAYNNLHKAGIDGLRYSEGWAAAVWFIPVLDLFMPYQIATDIWNKTQAANGEEIKHNRIVKWWFGTWVITRLANYLLFFWEISYFSYTKEEFVWSAFIEYLIMLSTILSLTAVIEMIRRIRSFEEVFFQKFKNNEMNIEDHLVE